MLLLSELAIRLGCHCRELLNHSMWHHSSTSIAQESQSPFHGFLRLRYDSWAKMQIAESVDFASESDFWWPAAY